MLRQLRWHLPISGPVIPPSTGLVLLAIYVGANVKKVLMGGLVPGILMATCMAVWSVYICNKRNYPKGEWKGFGYLFRVLRETFFSLIMPVLVVLCLSFGVGTVDEVGAGDVLLLRDRRCVRLQRAVASGYRRMCC